MGVIIHYINYDDTLQKESLCQIVAITSNASLSLSVGYDKQRTLHGSKNSRVYPDLPTTSLMEFIYVQ
jgi:hypothetical protein